MKSISQTNDGMNHSRSILLAKVGNNIPSNPRYFPLSMRIPIQFRPITQYLRWHDFAFITTDTTRSQLVGGFNHLEKYEFANGKDDIPYIMEHHPFMFETTNQTRSEFGCFSSFSVTKPLAFLLNSTNCMDGFRVAKLLLLDHPGGETPITRPSVCSHKNW